MHVCKLRMASESEKYSPSYGMFLKMTSGQQPRILEEEPQDRTHVALSGFPQMFGRSIPLTSGRRDDLSESISRWARFLSGTCCS